MNPALDRVVREVLAAGMRRGEVRRGYEAPTALVAEADPVVVVLPARWTWGGRLAQDGDLPAIEEALQGAIRARVALNHRYVAVPATVRRARLGEAAWGASAPMVVREAESVMDAPARPGRVDARVRVGRQVHLFGDGQDREIIPLGRGELVLGLFDGAVFLAPSLLLVRSDRGFSASPVQLTSGPFEIYDQAKDWPGAAWFRSPKAGTLLAEGEVLALAGAPVPVRAETLDRCYLSGDGVDLELHEGQLVGSVKHADSTVDVRIEPARGIIALRGTGRVIGLGALGRVLLDRFLDLEALPGEITAIDLGGKRLALSAPGAGPPRTRRRVTRAPASHAGGIDGIHAVSPEPGVLHLGEVLLAELVRPIFRALVACRVDGRPAAVGDMLPVRESFSIEVGNSSLSVCV